MNPIIAAAIAIVELVVSAVLVWILNKRVDMLIINSGLASILVLFFMLVTVTGMLIGPV